MCRWLAALRWIRFHASHRLCSRHVVSTTLRRWLTLAVILLAEGYRNSGGILDGSKSLFTLVMKQVGKKSAACHHVQLKYKQSPGPRA